MRQNKFYKFSHESSTICAEIAPYAAAWRSRSNIMRAVLRVEISNCFSVIRICSNQTGRNQFQKKVQFETLPMAGWCVLAGVLLLRKSRLRRHVCCFTQGCHVHVCVNLALCPAPSCNQKCGNTAPHRFARENSEGGTQSASEMMRWDESH